MHHVLQVLQPLFDRYGYLAIFATIFLEDFGVPMPGETTLIVGSLLASHSGLNIVALAAVAWTAAVLGDNVGYAIGRYAARNVILKVAKHLLINEKKISAAENAFKRRGAILVIIARFVEILRQLNGIVAGMARMPWQRFLPLNALGAGLWVAFWAGLAYEFGLRSENLTSLFRRFDLIFAALFVATVTSIVLARHIVHGGRTSRRWEVRRDRYIEPEQAAIEWSSSRASHEESENNS